MVATNDTEKGCATADLITKYTYYLSTMPIISSLTGVTSSMFAIEGFFLNGYAIHVAQKFNQERSNSNARKVFFTSLWYLPCWMVLFLLHSKKWHEGVKEGNEDLADRDLIQILKRKVDNVRQTGRELCPHELYAFAGGAQNEQTNTNGNNGGDGKVKGNGNSCPVKKLSSNSSATSRTRRLNE